MFETFTGYDPEYLDEVLPPLAPVRRDREEKDQKEVEPPVVLDNYGMQVWSGEKTVDKENGEVDRSRSLLNLGRVLYDAGATRTTVVETLKERDRSLGWGKHGGRKDDTEYHEIFEALEARGRNNVYSLDSRRKEPLPRRSSFKDRTPLHEIIKNGVEEPKELVKDILLQGKVHHLYSGPGSGKSWVALSISRSVLDWGESIAYLDKENGQRTMAERLEHLGIPLDKIEKHFYYYEDPATLMDKAVQRDFEEMLDEVEPALLVFDSLIGFMSDDGLNENEARDIQKWANAYLHPARKRGITVLILDHVPHEARRSRGSGRKKEEVDVQWELHKSQDFDRNNLGVINLRRQKDREGWLPNMVTFRLGGKEGRFIFERERKEENLSSSQLKALRILEEKLGFDGVKDGEWKEACKDYEDMADSTYYDAKKKLIEKGIVEEREGKFYPTFDWGF